MRLQLVGWASTWRLDAIHDPRTERPLVQALVLPEPLSEPSEVARPGNT